MAINERNIGDIVRVRKSASLHFLKDKDSVEVLGQWGRIVDKIIINEDYIEYMLKFENGKVYKFHQGHIDLRHLYSGNFKK